MSRQRALVLGAGLGGLASAARLQAKGYATTLIERNAVLGGRAHTFNRDGRIYDAGPTVVTAPHLFAELFTLFGERIEDSVTFLPVDPWYQYSFPDGDVFNYCGGERLLEEIRRVAPNDVDGYLRFKAYSEQLFARGYEGLGDQPFLRLGDMLRQTPYILKSGAFRSLYGMVSSFVRSEKLRQVLATPSLLVGGSPLETPAIYGLIHTLEQKWGVWFAKGGTGALITALGDLLKRHGVEIRLNETVTEIEVEHGQACAVRLEDGTRLCAEHIVSNMDPGHVYANLLPAVTSTFQRQRLSKLSYSFGLFVLFFATKRAHPSVAHHTILLQPDYCDGLRAITREGRISAKPSIYLHRPVATQADIHHSDEELYYALVPVPNLKVDRKPDWDTNGPWLQERTLEVLESRLMPGLSGHLNETFYTEPRDFESRFQSVHGAGFSISPKLTQSAWFRFHNRSSAVRNLYFVGAGTHPGAGMPGVLNSAKILDRLIGEA